MRGKITVRSVADLVAKENKEVTLRDSVLAGFEVRARPGWRMPDSRSRNGRQRAYTRWRTRTRIGSAHHGAIDPGKEAGRRLHE